MNRLEELCSPFVISVTAAAAEVRSILTVRCANACVITMLR